MIPLDYIRDTRCVACASHASHRSAVARIYGLQPGQWTELFKRQGGRCGNVECGAVSRSRRPMTDHDHVTMAPRGLLCMRCNDMLGFVEGAGRQHRAAAILRGLADYLDHPPAVRFGLVAPPPAEAIPF
jgi:hypothetical protein